MGTLTTAASIAQMTANDYQNAQSIYTSMQADAQKRCKCSEHSGNR